MSAYLIECWEHSLLQKDNNITINYTTNSHGVLWDWAQDSQVHPPLVWEDMHVNTNYRSIGLSLLFT